MEYILTFDVGTTGNKCSLFSRERPIAEANAGYGVSYPHPDWAEQTPEDFWDSCIRGTAELLEKSGVLPSEIVAIGLCGHMNGCIPIDAQGRALYPDIIHADARTGAQCAWMTRQMDGLDYYHISRNRVDPHYSIPKVLWLREHEPEVYRRAAFFLGSKDYLAGRLTGEIGHTDYSDASLMGGLDMERRVWSEEIFKALELPMERFPTLHPSTHRLGTLTAGAAKALGLLEGTPVIMGAGDGACATKGSAVVRPGQAYTCLGSSSWIGTLTPKALEDQRLFHYVDMDNKHLIVCGTVQNAGACYDWATAMLGLNEEFSGPALHEEVCRMADASPAGAKGLLFLPYLMGERTPHWDERARGAFVGISSAHTREDMMRAVMEGVAYALRETLDAFADNGLRIGSLLLLGGGARNRSWNRIMSAIFRRPLALHAMPGGATSMGAAMAAGVAMGWYADFEEAARLMPHPLPCEEEFDPAALAVVEEVYALYKRLYPALQDVFGAIADYQARC